MEQLDLEMLRSIATLLSDPGSLAFSCKYISASITSLGRVHEFAWCSRWHKELCPCRPWQYCALTWTKLRRFSLPELVEWMLQYALWCPAAATAVKLPRKATTGAHKQLARGNAVAALRLLCPHPEHLLLVYAATARRQDLVRQLIKSSRELSPSTELPASSKISCIHNARLTAALVASRCGDPHIMLILLASSPRPLNKWERRLLVNHAVELGQPEALMQLDLASTSYATADLQLRHHHLAKAAARTDAEAAAMVQHLLNVLPKKILQPKYLLPVYAAACRFANPHVLAVLVSHVLAAPAQLQLPASMLCAAAAQGAVLPAPFRLVVHALKVHIAQLSQAGPAFHHQQQPAAAAAAFLGRKRKASGEILTAAAAAADEAGPAAAVGTGRKRRACTAGDEAAAVPSAGLVRVTDTANSGAGDTAAAPITATTETPSLTGAAGGGLESQAAAAAAAGATAAQPARAAAAIAGPAATASPSNELALFPALLARALMHLLGSKAVWKERLGPGKIRDIRTLQVPSLGHFDLSKLSGLPGFRDVGSDPLLATQYASTTGQLQACQELWEFCGELGSSMQQQVEEVLCVEFYTAGWNGIGPVGGDWGKAGFRWMLRTLPKWKEQNGLMVEKLLQAMPEFDMVGEGQEHKAEGGGSEEDGGSGQKEGRDGEGAGDSSRGAAGAGSGGSHSVEDEQELDKQAAVAAARQQQQIQKQQQLLKEELDENIEQEGGQQQQQQDQGVKRRENQQQLEQPHQGGGEGGAEGQQHQQEGGQQEGNQHQHQQLHEQGQQQQEGNQQQPKQEEEEGDADEDENGPSAKTKFLFGAYMALSELCFVCAAIPWNPHVLDRCLTRYLARSFQHLPPGTEIGSAWINIWQPTVRQCLPGTCSWLLRSLDEGDRAQLGLPNKSIMQAWYPWVPRYAHYAARLWVGGDGVAGGGRDERGRETAAVLGENAVATVCRVFDFGASQRDLVSDEEGEGVPRAKRHAAVATPELGGAEASNKGGGDSILCDTAFGAAMGAAIGLTLPRAFLPQGVSSTWFSTAAAAPGPGAVASSPESTTVAAGDALTTDPELT